MLLKLLEAMEENQKTWPFSPSYLQRITYLTQTGQTIRLDIKRDDLLHPYLIGNKLRKSYPLLQSVLQSGNKKVATLGGAFSNHLLAIAGVGHSLNMETHGLVRGESIELNSPVLKRCREYGMKLYAIERSAYALLRQVRSHFIKEVHALIGEAHCIAEGGTEAEGLIGMAQSVLEVEDVGGYDFLACPVGTGGTAMGLALGLCHYLPHTHTKVLALSSLKGYQSVPHESVVAAQSFGGQDFIDTLLKRVCFIPESAGRGYGKTDESLLSFMYHWEENTDIPLDYVYTGKALRWIVEKLARYSDSKSPKILFFHTGGYQTAGLKKISPSDTLSFSLKPHREADPQQDVIAKG